MINNTLSSETIIQCHKQLTVPAILILYISTIFIFLLVGLVTAMKYKSMGKYMLIWILSSLFSVVVLIFLYLNPNIVQNIVDFIF